MVHEFLNELKKWHIRTCLEYGKLVLYEGDKQAREHYSGVLEDNPELAIQTILELSKTNMRIQELVEERAAIRESDFESAVRCNYL